MKIAMIGTGYVGLVSGVCFSDFGHDVICVDRDPAKIAMLERGEVPIFEPGLDTLMAKNVEAGRLSFTTDLKSAVDGAEAVFIAVGTPTRRGDGHADLTYVMAAAKEIAMAASEYVVIITKSTVPVGTNRQVKQVIKKARPDLDFDVASNPEFLREGAAIDDFMKPDRVVVGVQTERAGEVMADIYRPLYLRDFPILTTDLESAEMIKYAANAFLAMKITFINEIAALCERTGADVKRVSHGIGLDGRIGNKFLHAGPGYGGSCFPKDTKALARIGQEHGQAVKPIGVRHADRLTFPVGTNTVQLKVSKAVFVGGENQIVAAGVKERRPTHGTDVGQLANVATILVHGIDFGSQTVFGKPSPADAFSVRREEWSAVVTCHICQPPNVAAVRVHQVDVNEIRLVGLDQLRFTRRKRLAKFRPRIGCSVGRKNNFATVGAVASFGIVTGRVGQWVVVAIGKSFVDFVLGVIVPSVSGFIA